MKIKKEDKKKKKMIIRLLLWGLFLGIALVLLIVGINLYMVLKEKSRVLSVDEVSDIQADCILVLGAGIREDGSPTWMLEDRIKIGDRLYQQGCASKIIMSGDHGREEHDEVNTMKNYAVAEGVPSEDIFMDHAGFSSYDSIYRAKEIFKVNKLVIITQKYHLYRSLHIAKKLNLRAYGIKADKRKYKKQTYRELREILARNKDFFKCILKPKPQFLGEEILITGDGDITND